MYLNYLKTAKIIIFVQISNFVKKLELQTLIKKDFIYMFLILLVKTFLKTCTQCSSF